VFESVSVSVFEFVFEGGSGGRAGRAWWVETDDRQRPRRVLLASLRSSPPGCILGRARCAQAGGVDL